MVKKWGDEDGNGPTTESLKRRGRKVQENGVVEGKGYIGLFASFAGIVVTLYLVFFA